MRSRQPAGSATTIARDHFPTIVEQDRKVRFPADLALLIRLVAPASSLML